MAPAAEKIKKPILIPVAGSIMLFLVVSIGLAAGLQKKYINEGMMAYTQSTRLLFDVTLTEESELLRTLLNFYKDDKKLLMAYQLGDRQALLDFAAPISEKIHREYQVTHFYFIDLDKRCFLRTYSPERYGDVIKRFTLDRAVETGKFQAGLELGCFGTLTLRAVMPWRLNGKVIGYLEFGKEINSITPVLKNTLGLELFLAVDTRYLKKELWEEGQKIMGNPAKGEVLAGHLIISRTMSEVPREVARFLKLPSEARHGQDFKVSVGRRHYRGGIIPFFDVSGKNIGEIVALKDFSATEHSLEMLSGMLISLVVVMLSGLSLFIYGVTSKVEGRLRKSREALEVEIRERARAEGQIQASLDEKEVLLKEIHHRVKNNMQIVCSLFRMQLRRIDNPRVLEILKDSESRISAMALVHKTLYQPQNLSSIHLRGYIRELALSVFETYGVDPERISLRVEAESVPMDIDTVTPCGLIINELVTNAIKYAFPDGRCGEIVIVFACREQGGYTLSVRDDGVGLPDDFELRRGDSLGMQLVVNLTESQLKGKLELNRQNGTEFVVHFREL